MTDVSRLSLIIIIIIINLSQLDAVFVIVEMPEKRVGVAGSISQTMSLCQETVIKWFANYAVTVKKPSEPPSQQTNKPRLVTVVVIGLLSCSQ